MENCMRTSCQQRCPSTCVCFLFLENLWKSTWWSTSANGAVPTLTFPQITLALNRAENKWLPAVTGEGGKEDGNVESSTLKRRKWNRVSFSFHIFASGAGGGAEIHSIKGQLRLIENVCYCLEEQENRSQGYPSRWKSEGEMRVTERWPRICI